MQSQDLVSTQYYSFLTKVNPTAAIGLIAALIAVRIKGSLHAIRYYLSFANPMIMASSWIYLTLGVIIALIALGAVAINTALEQANMTDVTSHGGPVTDYVSLIDNLRATGATVEPSGKISQPFFFVEGQVISINGVEVQVFEYADIAVADAEANLVSHDGSSIGTSMVNWVATPHFYKTGKLIMLYVGDNMTVISTLETVLGPQFAGR